jgi:spore germination protein KC
MKIKLVIISLFCLLLTGCYNYNELNTLAIATGMSIDYQENQYDVSILIANSKQAQVSSKEGESQSIVYEGKGLTLSEAIKKIDNISPKKIYIGHLSFIVISEDLAKKGLLDSLDYLLREPESIKRFYLIMAHNTKAKNILEIVSPLESFPAQSVSTAISFSKESQAIASNIPYSTFIDNLVKKGAEPILATIELKGNVEDGKSEESLLTTTPKAYLQLSTLALFKKDKLVHITDEEESEGINIINDDVGELLLDCNCSGGKAEIEIENLKVSKKVSIDNGNPTISIQVKGNGSLQENTCTIDLEDEKTVLDLEEKANEEIDRLIKKAIAVTKKYETDVFGFGNLIYKFHPKIFNNLENNWNEIGFKNLNITTKIDIRLEFKGSTESRIKEK